MINTARQVAVRAPRTWSARSISGSTLSEPHAPLTSHLPQAESSHFIPVEACEKVRTDMTLNGRMSIVLGENRDGSLVQILGSLTHDA